MSSRELLARLYDTNHLVVLFLAAFIAAAVNSVAGGGGFITFPALLFVGVPPVQANATNNAATWFGVVASARGYHEDTRQYWRLTVPALGISAIGALLGALLLLHTPTHTFERLIPWLMLLATAAFAISPFITAARESHRIHAPWQLALQFLISIYGGYFGAGIGILMLAILSFSPLSINAMNGAKNLLSVTINGVIIIVFSFAGIIVWHIALPMAAFTVAGGYIGARVFRRLPSAATRAVVLAIAIAMTTYFFVRYG